MISSPCAMLITPITPKVMARPTAASSSTDPSDSPNQTFCSCAPHRLRCARSRPPPPSPPRRSPAPRRSAAASAPPAPRCRRARRPRPPPPPGRRAAASDFEQRRRPRLLERPPDARRPVSAASAACDRLELLRVGGCGTPRPPPPAAAPDRRDISVSVEIAERTARRSALFTLIALGRARRHRPELGPGQRVERLGLRPAPGDADHRAVRLARVRGRPPAARRAPPPPARRRWRRSPRPPRRGRRSCPPAAAAISSSSDCAERGPHARARPSQSERARREGASVSSGGTARAGPRGPRAAGQRQFVAPPHSPVLALKFPQDIGARQLAIRSADSGR